VHKAALKTSEGSCTSTVQLTNEVMNLLWSYSTLREMARCL